MSLRTFHVIFIICSIALSIGFGYWAVKGYFDSRAVGYLWTAFGSVTLAVGLIIYEILFLKKGNA